MKKKNKKKKQTQSNRTQEIKNNEVVVLSTSKKRIFYGILLLIPILLILILELGLNLFHYGIDLPLFVSTPNEQSVYYGINTDIGKRYFHSDNFSPTPRKDLFLKEKPENGYRIFVLGGSTTAGFPYGNNLTFTRILNRRLADVFPDKKIEVINTALTAVNSYTLLDFMDEILHQQPDALFIYAGHNEFYGALGVGSTESLGKIPAVIHTYLKLQKFKTFQLVRNTIARIRGVFASSPKDDLRFDPMKTEMSRIVREKNIPLNSALYKHGKNQFATNIDIILKKAAGQNIPVLISELVSNIRDHKPFVSVNDDSSLSADFYFKKGRVLEKNKNYPEAKRAYYQAKDLDALRFRATEEFNLIIHELAQKYNATLVPMKACFENASPGELIRNNLMHEHLHPNKSGYFLMAEAFLNAMRQQGMIAGNWPEPRIRPSAFYDQNWGFTILDSTYAALNILHLKGGWPFKETSPNMALYEFQPKTKEDSVALRILKSPDLTLELGHIEMTQYYLAKGDLANAFRESKALIYTVPNLDIFYEPTLDLLISNNLYDLALQLLNDALKFNESPFIYKWLGQVNLVLENDARGIAYLEKSREMSPNDPQLLFNLGRAYFKTAQPAKGNAILANLRQIAPQSPVIGMLEDYKKSLVNK